jgi:hypothetical protein
MSDTNTSSSHNVFLSWSGEWAKDVASILRDWLVDVVRQAKPWMSSEDIAKGSAWESEISGTLGSCTTGIVVLTPHSAGAPWVLFEAGAISKSVSGHVCTLLCGLAPPITGPLGRFQATTCEKADLFKLVKTIDTDLGGTSAAKLEHWFEAFWGGLEAKLLASEKKHNKAQAPIQQPSQAEVLKEILTTVRSIQRTQEDVRVQSPITIGGLGLIADPTINSTSVMRTVGPEHYIPISHLSDVAGARVHPRIRSEMSPQMLEVLKSLDPARRERAEALMNLVTEEIASSPREARTRAPGSIIDDGMELDFKSQRMADGATRVTFLRLEVDRPPPPGHDSKGLG